MYLTQCGVCLEMRVHYEIPGDLALKLRCSLSHFLASFFPPHLISNRVFPTAESFIADMHYFHFKQAILTRL